MFFLPKGVFQRNYIRFFTVGCNFWYILSYSRAFVANYNSYDDRVNLKNIHVIYRALIRILDLFLVNIMRNLPLGSSYCSLCISCQCVIDKRPRKRADRVRFGSNINGSKSWRDCKGADRLGMNAHTKFAIKLIYFSRRLNKSLSFSLPISDTRAENAHIRKGIQ